MTLSGFVVSVFVLFTVVIVNVTALFVKLAVTFTASPAMQLFFGSVVKKPPSVAFILIISPGSVAFFQQRALVSFSTGTGKYFSQ